MKHLDYMAYLRSYETQHPSYAVVARSYRMIDGTEHLVHLPQGVWDYADWLEETGEALMTFELMHCAKLANRETSLSHVLLFRLWQDECRRHLDGLPTPTVEPPMGFDAWVNAANDP